MYFADFNYFYFKVLETNSIANKLINCSDLVKKRIIYITLISTKNASLSPRNKLAFN
ncbi:hypothetical protein TEHD86_1910 [Tetragenococcus halophilus subsp. halophilus]|nr:hypothetical protein TEHN0098T_0329 [Tetragenococcus halophilus subsp. halophilus]GFK21266.1 hypothetical protein WJ7_07290 [Tetragenococcus halophilus]GMA44373.1 hypothetical protein GCM10025853_18300 [Tetragenococcus halophilus subsp. halophilus DSM 20339]GBD73771.1 hypothetical protein TEHN7125_1931 [Tetragenococcus halophilus subsp. halophilus]GBD76194.1 hypothetical protein TEHN7126_1893 [Tetragenococcus halophilus subsp. halophilus]